MLASVGGWKYVFDKGNPEVIPVRKGEDPFSLAMDSLLP